MIVSAWALRSYSSVSATHTDLHSNLSVHSGIPKVLKNLILTSSPILLLLMRVSLVSILQSRIVQSILIAVIIQVAALASVSPVIYHHLTMAITQKQL